MNAHLPKAALAGARIDVEGAAPDAALGPAARGRAEREALKLEKRLTRQVGRAIAEFNMIEAGDRVMVCLSGGKDSYALLDILLKMQARAPVAFELVAVNLDQKQPGFPAHVLPEYLARLGVEHHIETQDTYSIVKAKIPEGKTTCSLCSRLRRGILYTVARRLKCNKIALGHHRDDMLQTFFLNMFFGGKLKGMPPKLASDNGEFIVIRPLAHVAEKDLIAWAAHRQFPIIPCNLCGSQENLQRQVIGDMLRGWQKNHPGRIENMFTALQNVVPSHLMDARLHDFQHLRATGVADEEGDKAFDDEAVVTRVATPSGAAPLGAARWSGEAGEPAGDVGGDVVGDVVGDLVGDLAGDLAGDRAPGADAAPLRRVVWPLADLRG